MEQAERIPMLLVCGRPFLGAVLADWCEAAGHAVRVVRDRSACVLALNTGAAPRLVLVDLSGIADADDDTAEAFGLLRWLHKYRPALRVVALGHAAGDAVVRRCYRDGAHAYLCTTGTAQQVLLALRNVLTGGVHHTERSLALVLEDAGALSPEERRRLQVREALTWTERRLLVALVQQMEPTYARLAQEMHLEVRAVEYRIQRLYAKFGVTNMTGLVLAALRSGAVRL